MTIMIGKSVRQLAAAGILIAALGAGQLSAQKTQKPVQVAPSIQQFQTLDQPDAKRTHDEFIRLLNRYPPTVKGVFRQDPTLMTQPQYLATYPALAAYLASHPEIAANPSYYLDGLGREEFREPNDHASQVTRMWENFAQALAVITGFGMAIGLLTWLVRTFLDYRRWNRLSKVQTEVHTRLLDRFSSNEELMAYIATPAGSKFLSSAPISLDSGSAPRAMNAPLSRIMWSVQAGFVLGAAGAGLMLASGRVADDYGLPLEIMGILAAALGVGFAVSAGVSFALSHKLGLLDRIPQRRPTDGPEAQ